MMTADGRLTGPRLTPRLANVQDMGADCFAFLGRGRGRAARAHGHPIGQVRTARLPGKVCASGELL